MQPYYNGYSSFPIPGFNPNTMGVGGAGSGPIYMPGQYTSPPIPGAPTTPGVTSTPGQVSPAATELGWNLGTGQLALGTLGAAGNLWNGWQATSLANRTFDFSKRMQETNLANSIKSYNTQLEDRARARAVTEGQSDQQRDDYVARNRL